MEHTPSVGSRDSRLHKERVALLLHRAIDGQLCSGLGYRWLLFTLVIMTNQTGRFVCRASTARQISLSDDTAAAAAAILVANVAFANTTQYTSSLFSSAKPI